MTPTTWKAFGEELLAWLIALPIVWWLLRWAWRMW